MGLTYHLDTDNDLLANCIDLDDDSYLDENDAFPLDDSEWIDSDGDPEIQPLISEFMPPNGMV